MDLNGKAAIVTGGTKGIGYMIAERLVKAGVKELLVISQDTSAYGVDMKYRTGFWQGRPVKTKMLDMCEALSELGAWVRLHYVYPYPHVDDIIPLMAEGKMEEGMKALAKVRSPHAAARKVPPVVIALKREGRAWPIVVTDFVKASMQAVQLPQCMPALAGWSGTSSRLV